MKLVLDTSVVTFSFRSRNGASRGMIDAFDQGRFELLLSTSLLMEYEDVLTRPEQMAVHGFSLHEVTRILDTMTKRAIRVHAQHSWYPSLRDRDDDHVLVTAISGGAFVIVTHNLSDFLPQAEDFGIRVVTPGRMLREGLKQ